MWFDDGKRQSETNQIQKQKGKTNWFAFRKCRFQRQLSIDTLIGCQSKLSKHNFNLIWMVMLLLHNLWIFDTNFGIVHIYTSLMIVLKRKRVAMKSGLIFWPISMCICNTYHFFICESITTWRTLKRIFDIFLAL